MQLLMQRMAHKLERMAQLHMLDEHIVHKVTRRIELMLSTFLLVVRLDVGVGN
jgi:hypothetical protein